MKTSDYLIITSTETCEGVTVTPSMIVDWHTQPRAQGGLGFNRPGFDYLVQPDGRLEAILPETHPNDVDVWGCSEGADGISGTFRFLAYVGGRSKATATGKAGKAKDTRTEAQKATLATVVAFYVRRFPEIQVLGWDEVPAKKGTGNPGFALIPWLKEHGISAENAYVKKE